MRRPVIALITDFGLHDVYVGVMKGVILGVNPEARIVDVTHSVPRHDVAAGSYALSASLDYFPEGTVFAVVVDPGVGSDRAVICARSDGRYFLAPDNGVLAPVLTGRGYDALVRVEREDLYLRPVSSTFHGRDVFAPVAARLSAGLDIGALGREVSDFVRLDAPEAEAGPEGVKAGVAWVDAFGNVITTCPARLVDAVIGRWGRIAVHGRDASFPLVACYEAVPPGELLAIVGSSGFLEISVREGNAARLLGLGTGDGILLVDGGRM